MRKSYDQLSICPSVEKFYRIKIEDTRRKKTFCGQEEKRCFKTNFEQIDTDIRLGRFISDCSTGKKNSTLGENLACERKHD